MIDKKFDVSKLQKLNNPKRLLEIPLQYIANNLNLKNSDTFIDIGAGTAFFSLAFLNQFSPKTIYACDISTEMISWIKENISSQHPKIVPVKSEENSIPLDSQIADLVFMLNLHHELDNPLKMINEAKRLLKKGAKLLIIDWKKAASNEGPPFQIRCTVEEVVSQLTNSGFHNIQTSMQLPKHFFITAEK